MQLTQSKSRNLFLPAGWYTSYKRMTRLAWLGVDLLTAVWFGLILVVMNSNLFRTNFDSAGAAARHAGESLGVIGLLAAIYPLYQVKLTRRLLPERSLALVIFLAVVFSRAAWLLFTGPVQISSDFELYFQTALRILDGSSFSTGESWYLGYAPYVLGYATFLAGLMWLFGESLVVAQAANVLLAGLTGMFLYLIARKITGRPEGGLVAACAWILIPAMTAMVSFPGTETPFLAAMTATVYACLHLFDHRPSMNWLAIGSAGLLFVLMNEFRPLGMFLIVSLGLITAVLFRPGKRTSLLRVIGAGGLVAFFMLASAQLTVLKEGYIGREVSRSPFGFGLYLGLNDDSTGTWNLDDASFLAEAERAGMNAQDFQISMVARSKDRFKALAAGGKIPGLLLRKVATLWSYPNAYMEWIEVGVAWDLPGRILFDNFRFLSNQVYAALVLFGLAEVGMSRIHSYPVSLPGILLVRTVLVFLLVGLAVFDNNSRYMIPAVPLFCVLAGSGVVRLSGRVEKSRRVKAV